MTDKEWNRKYSQIRRAQYQAEGKCVACGRTNDRVAQGLKTCSKCAETNRRAAKRLREARKEAHLCAKCGKPLDSTLHAYCEECLEKHRAWKKRAKP